ncbi:hypothetical protein PVK06_012366 [Gossypium arboreum]|uniref:SWIM-type domain-containing protein n=1 Tax=Gossypium arboreum TaxID=29729 RepID=A0ABR0QB79_GOSAR|nr:hypothetical protein PVK06_012366 [Gossypium arboreum]
MEYTTPARHSGRYETSTRRDDVHPTTSTGEGTSYIADDGGLDDKSHMDPPREPDPDGELEVGKELSNKDSFLGALKQYSIMNGVNNNVVKSKSKKFEVKCAVQDGVSQYHPKMDSDMIASLILLMVKKDPRTSVSILIANIRSQLSFKQYRDVFVYWKPSVQIDGTFMYGRHIYQLLLVTTQDGGRRILPIAFAITLEESGTHHLPITLVVQETYFYLATLFPKLVASYKGQMQGGPVWCQKVLQEINKAKARANTMHKMCHNRNNLWFLLTDFDRPNQSIIGGQYRVHLRNRTCDCGTFDALSYLCTHVIAACQNLHLDRMRYVDEV